jgi:hypothetical protein
MAMNREGVVRRTVAWFPMSGPAAVHGLGWGLEQGEGYDPLFERYATPLAGVGVEGFGIWMPHGYGTIDVPGLLNFEALADMRDRGLGYLVGDLPYHLRRHQRRFPRAWWVIYLGSMLERTLQGLKGEGRKLAYTRRIIDTLGELLDIGSVSIALDNRTSFPAGSPEHRMADYIAALIAAPCERPQPRPRLCYTEGMPHRAMPHLAGVPVCATEREFSNRPSDDRYHEGQPQHNWATPTQDLTGEVIRIDQVPIAGTPAEVAAGMVQRAARVVGHPMGNHVWAGGLFYSVGPGRTFASADAWGDAVAGTANAWLAGDDSVAAGGN